VWHEGLVVVVLVAVIIGGAVPAHATGTVVWESKSLKVTTTIVDSELHVILHRLVVKSHGRYYGSCTWDD
jgi:hypothetical protein